MFRYFFHEGFILFHIVGFCSCCGQTCLPHQCCFVTSAQLCQLIQEVLFSTAHKATVIHQFRSARVIVTCSTLRRVVKSARSVGPIFFTTISTLISITLAALEGDYTCLRNITPFHHALNVGPTATSYDAIRTCGFFPPGRLRVENERCQEKHRRECFRPSDDTGHLERDTK